MQHFQLIVEGSQQIGNTLHCHFNRFLFNNFFGFVRL